MRKDTIKRYARIATSSLRRALFGVDRAFGPRHLTFELTNLCNSKCEMCHIWANQPNDNILTTEEIRRIFADPGFANLDDVILTGGEIFMRDDIPEIVSAIWNTNKRVNIFLSTNGILANKIISTGEIIAKSDIPVFYGISLDGIGEAHEKRRRAEGNFEAIDQILIPGLMRLGKQYPGLINIAVGHCLDEYGIQTFEDVRKYCDSRGITFLTQMIEDFDYYLPEKKRERKTGGWEKIHLVKKGMDGKNRLMKKAIYAVDQSKYASYIRRLIPTVHHFRLLSILEGRDTRYECSSLRNFFLLRYDGSVAPCLRFADWEVANLKSTSVRELADSENRERAVTEVLNCDGCLNTWCTDWSMEKNAMPFHREVAKWLVAKTARISLRADVSQRKT